MPLIQPGRRLEAGAFASSWWPLSFRGLPLAAVSRAMVTPMAVQDAPATSSRASVVARASAPDTGGTRVVLHPLALMNIADHHTRFVALDLFPLPAHAPASAEDERPTFLRDGAKRPWVVGILLGNQEGAAVEICHSFELPAKAGEDGRTEIDEEFLRRRLEQFRQIFPKCAVVGWYSTKGDVGADELRLHTKVFSDLNEAPVLLVVHPTDEPPKVGGVDADVSAFQAELHQAGNSLQPVLARVPHSYASAEAERIAVDHVTRHAVPGKGDAVSNTVVHLMALRRSIGMLQMRVKVIVAFLEQADNGNVRKDHAILRQIAGVVARLPAVGSPMMEAAFVGEVDDSTVVGYLAGVTRAMCALNELVSKFGFAYDKPASGDHRRKGGLW